MIVIPTPDGNDTVMQLLLLHSMKDDDVVTLSPIEIKLSVTSASSSFTINDSTLALVLTYGSICDIDTVVF